jgi:hypothetical protein
MDGTYVTIWYGLLEPIFTEAELTEGLLASVEKPEGLDLHGSYNEDLFRGHIETDEAARHILKALRVGADGRYTMPHILEAGTGNKLSCGPMA